jgi:hypothetical protein
LGFKNGIRELLRKRSEKKDTSLARFQEFLMVQESLATHFFSKSILELRRQILVVIEIVYKQMMISEKQAWEKTFCLYAVIEPKEALLEVSHEMQQRTKNDPAAAILCEISWELDLPPLWIRMDEDGKVKMETYDEAAQRLLKAASIAKPEALEAYWNRFEATGFKIVRE